MDDQTLAIVTAIFNLIVSSIRLYYCARAKRLITIVWFLVAYFSIFFVELAIGGTFVHTQGFTLATIKIGADGIYRACLFVLEFNLVFLFSEIIIWRLSFSRMKKIVWRLPTASSEFDRLCVVLGLLLVVGTIWYWYTTKEQGYRDYVEFKGSNWGIVFLWASSPCITIFALRRKFSLAILATIPFLYFAFHLKVRSFALFSAIPVVIIALLQGGWGKSVSFKERFSSVIVAASLSIALLVSSVLIIQAKNIKDKRLSLPDSDMAVGAVIVMRSADLYREHTDFDSLMLYFENYINPFVRLAEKMEWIAHEKEIIDPPVIMAELIEGVPRNWGVYFHYPALWYSDAYLAFRDLGLLCAVLWAMICVAFERIMSRNSILLALLLPFYCWHSYMLIRGAIAEASNPFMYAAYISFMLIFMFLGSRTTKAVKQNGGSNAKMT